MSKEQIFKQLDELAELKKGLDEVDAILEKYKNNPDKQIYRDFVAVTQKYAHYHAAALVAALADTYKNERKGLYDSVRK